MISIVVESESVKIGLLHQPMMFLDYLTKLYALAADSWTGYCPVCGRPLTRHGGYLRKTPAQFGLKLRIRRVRCKQCKLTHALLPCFLIPYGRHLDVSVELAINPDANDGLTIEKLAEITGAEPSTIVRWRCKFRAVAHNLFDRMAKTLAQMSFPVARWLWIGSLDPPERKVFRLVAVLRSMLNARFPFSDLAFINLLFTHKINGICRQPIR